MFFLLSKLAGPFLMLENVLLLALVLGVAVLFTRFKRTGRGLVAAGTLGFLVFGYGPVGSILLRPLEDRFALPPPDMPEPFGIIVLGGAISPEMTKARGPVALTRDGARAVEGVTLALRYPGARLVFAGGSAAIFSEQIDEAGAAERLFRGLGIAQDRIALDRQSRSTYENALFTRDLVKPEPGQRWLLVTSANHMPRAVGVFRQAGFSVTPYPVAYLTAGGPSEFYDIASDPSGGLMRTDTAIHEWLGLFAYWLTGKSGALLPSP